jgi:hypothetical protein
MASRKTTLTTGINKALDALALEPKDAAVVQLAKHYAAAIDKDAFLLKKLGPELLETLMQLGLTPRARNAVMGGGVTPDGHSDKITELRSRRQRRAADLVEASS